MGGFGTIRGGSGGGTAAGVGSAPNQIPGLIVWFCARDRESGPVITTGTLGQSLPISFDLAGLLNRAVFNSPGTVGHGYGTAYLTPNWSGASINTWPNTPPPTSLYLGCDIGANRFLASGWTFLELWFPTQDILPPGQHKLQMAYRFDTAVSTEILGPTIITWNPAAGTGTGFAGVAPSGAPVPPTTPIFPIVWGTGWYILGLDGRAGGNLKIRINGINSVPQALAALTATTANKIVWGVAGQGQLLEACVWDRPLADAEYAAVERHWIAKYDNIHLGRVGAPVAGSEFRL